MKKLLKKLKLNMSDFNETKKEIIDIYNIRFKEQRGIDI